MAGFWKKKWNFRVFWGFGAFPAREFCYVIFGPAPLLRPKEKKTANYYFFDLQWVKTTVKPLFIEISIEKS